MNVVESVKELFLQSGAGWVMWFLFGLSAITLGVALERWLYFRSVGGDLPALAARLDAHLQARAVEEAIAELSAGKSVAGAVAVAGLRLSNMGPAAAEKAMLSAAALERSRLEKRLAFLGTVGNNAPFIGLFGTVIGVIVAFEELGHGAPGHATAGAAGQVASQAVMSSIAEALVATAVGIFVALPAVALNNLLHRQVAGMLSGTEVVSNLVLAYLSKTSQAQQTEQK
jgi:biopolymer transport protein ExbB